MAKDDTSSSSGDSSDSSEDEQAVVPKTIPRTPKEKQQVSSDDDDDSSDDSSVEEQKKKKMKQKKTTSSTKKKKDKNDMSDDDDDDTKDSNPPESNKRKSSSSSDGKDGPSNKKMRKKGTPKPSKLFVLGLPYKATAEEVKEFFSTNKMGAKVVSVDLPQDRNGRSSGTAIVEFDVEDVSDAVQQYHKMDFQGRWLEVSIYEEPSKGRKLYVKGLPWRTSQAEVMEYLNKNSVGAKVLNCDLPRMEDGRSSGTAIVEMDSDEGAKSTMDEFQGKDFSGRWLKIDFYEDRHMHRPGEQHVVRLPRDQKNTGVIFVGNLPFEMEEDSLREALEPSCGEISSIRLSKSGGFGHVEFAKSESADVAVTKMQGTMVSGRPIRVDYATKSGGNNNRNRGMMNHAGYGGGGRRFGGGGARFGGRGRPSYRSNKVSFD